MAFLSFLHQKQGGGSGLPPITPNRLGQLILNTVRPAMALQTTDGASTPTITTAAFGPALVTSGQVFPAPRDASISSCEFMFSTNRGIGPGLFFQEPLKAAPTPSSDILAGSFQSAPNKLLFIGPDSNPQTFATPTSPLAGDTISLGANSGILGKRSISIGSSAQPNAVVTGGQPADQNIAIGQKAMSGIFSQAKSGDFIFPISSNVAIGAEAMGISPLAPTVKSAASQAVVVGCKSGLGFIGTIDAKNPEPYSTKYLAQFTVVGVNSWWLKKAGEKNPWGASVILGSKNYQSAYPYASGGDYYTQANCDYSVCIGNNIFSTQDSAATKFTVIGKPTTTRTSYFTSISTLTGPYAYSEETDPSLTRPFSIANGSIRSDSGRTVDTTFRRPGTGDNGYKFFTFTAERQTLQPPILWNFSWTSPLGSSGFGPYISSGLEKQITYGNAVSTLGYTVANGSFTDESGKIYTVKNGLITSIA